MFSLRVAVIAGVFALLGLSTGCVVVREYPQPEEKITATPEEHKLARALLTAFVKNDAKTFVSLLPEETRKNFTEESFAATRKAVTESVGEPYSFTYVTTLKLTALNPQIWKVCFKRSNINNTREYTSEVLFKVITGMSSKKEAVITGFHFL